MITHEQDDGRLAFDDLFIINSEAVNHHGCRVSIAAEHVWLQSANHGCRVSAFVQIVIVGYVMHGVLSTPSQMPRFNICPMCRHRCKGY